MVSILQRFSRVSQKLQMLELNCLRFTLLLFCVTNDSPNKTFVPLLGFDLQGDFENFLFLY